MYLKNITFFILISLFMFKTQAEAQSPIESCPSVSYNYYTKDSNGKMVRQNGTLNYKDFPSLEESGSTADSYVIDQVIKAGIPINEGTEFLHNTACTEDEFEYINDKNKEKSYSCNSNNSGLNAFASVAKDYSENVDKVCKKKSPEYMKQCLNDLMSGKTYSQCIARVVQGGLTSVANTVGVFFYSLPKMLYETSTGAMNKAYKKVYDSTLLKLARRETTIEEELAKRDPTKSYLDSIISPEKRKKIKEALTWWTVFKDSEDLSSDVLKFTAKQSKKTLAGTIKVAKKMDQIRASVILASIQAYTCVEWDYKIRKGEKDLQCLKNDNPDCLSCKNIIEVGCGMFGYVAGEIPAGAGMGAMLKGIATARKLSANAVKGSKLAKSKTGRAIVASTPVQKGLRFVENIEKGFLKSLEKAGATSRFFINQSNKVYKTVVADVGGGLIKKTVRVTSGQVPVRLSMAIENMRSLPDWYLSMIDRSLQFGLKGKKGWKEATDKYLDTKALVLAERRKAKKLDLKYANYPIRKLIATGNGSRIAKNRNIPELESELKALDNMIDDLEKVKKNTKSSSGLVVGGEAGAGTGGDVPTEGASSTVTEPTQPKVSDPATPKASEPIAPEVSEPTAPKTTEPIAPEVSEPIAPEVSEPAVPKASEPTTPEVPKEATPDVNPNTADQAVDAQQGEALNKAKEDREEELEENSDKKPTSIESGVEKVNQILDSIIEE